MLYFGSAVFLWKYGRRLTVSHSFLLLRTRSCIHSSFEEPKQKADNCFATKYATIAAVANYFSCRSVLPVPSPSECERASQNELSGNYCYESRHSWGFSPTRKKCGRFKPQYAHGFLWSFLWISDRMKNIWISDICDVMSSKLLLLSISLSVMRAAKGPVKSHVKIVFVEILNSQIYQTYSICVRFFCSIISKVIIIFLTHAKFLMLSGLHNDRHWFHENFVSLNPSI